MRSREANALCSANLRSISIFASEEIDRPLWIANASATLAVVFDHDHFAAECCVLQEVLQVFVLVNRYVAFCGHGVTWLLAVPLAYDCDEISAKAMGGSVRGKSARLVDYCELAYRVVVLVAPTTLFLVVNNKTIVAPSLRLAPERLSAVCNSTYRHFHRNNSINLYSYIVPMRLGSARKLSPFQHSEIV